MNSPDGSFGVGEVWAASDPQNSGDTAGWSPIDPNACTCTSATYSPLPASSESALTEWTAAGYHETQLEWTADDAFRALEAVYCNAHSNFPQPGVLASNCSTVNGTQVYLWGPGIGFCSTEDGLMHSQHITDLARFPACVWDTSNQTGLSSAQLPPPAGAEMIAKLFQDLPPRRLEPQSHDSSADISLRQQTPRSGGDLYTAQWTRGERADRAGFCGYCCSWFKLKDSAYWVSIEWPLTSYPPTDDSSSITCTTPTASPA